MVDSQIEEIKNKLNIVEVIGGYVKLTKTGVNHRGICPFHSEKGPSFFVSPTRQMWHCFGCGAGSSIFDFIMQIEGIEFGDALKILAAKAGVELKRENPQLVSERKKLYEICDLACSFFEKQLGNSVYGKEAKEYLLKRGIKSESIKKWRLGYSPDTWQGLSDFLVSRGYNREEIVRAGLAVQSEKGNNPYDRFRGRIIFPIFDLNSQVIGFGARIFSAGVPSGSYPSRKDMETAKYINTPQTMLYDKSNVLYGINYAKLSIRKNNLCVLTEGYTDAIMCHQAGFENTAAVSGTALTPRHLNILKRYSDNLLLAFDMDVAGSNATNRGIDLAISQEFNIKVINTYSNAKDPAEIILEDPKKWEESVGSARPIMDFYFDFLFSHFDKNDPQGRKEIKNFLFPKFNIIPTQTEQNKQRQRLAKEFNVLEESILQDFKDWKQKNTNGESIKKVSSSAKGFLGNKNNFTWEGRKKLLEEKIILLVLRDPENLNLIEESHNCLFCDETKNLIESIKKNALQKENDIEAVSADAPSTAKPLRSHDVTTEVVDIGTKDECKDLIDTLSLKAEVECEEDGPEEIQLCLNQLKEIMARQELGKISDSIRTEKDSLKEEELKKEFNTKAKALHIKK